MPKKTEPFTTSAAQLAASAPGSGPGSAPEPASRIPAPGPDAPTDQAPGVAAVAAKGGEGGRGGDGSELSDGLGPENSEDKGGLSRDASVQNFAAPKEGSGAATATGASLDFDTKEKNVRRGFGLSEDGIRELRQRHLVQGVDWDYKNRAVCYSRRGVETLRAAIAAGTQKTDAAPSAPSPAQLEPLKEDVPVTLIVWKAKLPNGRQILAHLAGADADNKPEARFRVVVRHPEKFIKGMEIPCRPLDQTGTLYELAAPEPRRKGRMPA